MASRPARVALWLELSERRLVNDCQVPADELTRPGAAAASSSELARIFQTFEVTKESAVRFRKTLTQIKVDLPRTWAENPLFNDSKAIGCVKLERILMAFHLKHSYDYLQSMNFVAALVLHCCMGVEPDAFTIMSAVFLSVPYYNPHNGLDVLRKDTEFLALELRSRDPGLATHLFDSCQIDLICVTPSWFLTCFFQVVSPENSARVIESVLRNQGRTRGLFLAVALTVLQACREDLLRAKDIEGVFPLLKSVDAKFNRGFVAEPPDIFSDSDIHARHAELKSNWDGVNDENSSGDGNGGGRRRRVFYLSVDP